LRAITNQNAAIATGLAASHALPAIAGHAACTTTAPDAIEGPVTIDPQFPCGPARLIVPRPLLNHLLCQLDPACAAATPPWAMLLLETLLAPEIAQLETAHPSLAPTLRIGGACPSDFAIGISIAGMTLRLELGRDAAATLAESLARCERLRARRPDLIMRLHPRIMAASVPLAQLARAEPGDVVMARALPEGEVWIVLGEQFIWPAARERARLTVTGARQSAAAELEAFWMDDEDTVAPQEDSALDSVPVRLSFELGRIEMTLGELETLGPGHVFALGRAEDDAVDILANGKRIGAGRPILIGGAPGVQITRISGR
jgi:type III secretion protein Q